MKTTNLYKGKLNWYGEILTLYTWAADEDAALRNICFQFACYLEKTRQTVYHHFKGTNRWEIKLVEPFDEETAKPEVAKTTKKGNHNARQKQ